MPEAGKSGGQRDGSTGGRAGRGRGRWRSVEIAAVARHVAVRVGTFDAQSAVQVLVGGEGVDGIGLRARPERAALHAGIIFVVQALVRGLGVQIDGAGAGGTRRSALVGEVESAAGKIADDGGVAAHRQIAAERQRKRADGAGKSWRGWIVRKDYVGDLFGGDRRARNFDFILAGRGIEEVVAEAVGGGGVGERLGECRVRVNEGERRARLTACGHGADAHGRSGKRDAARIEDDVVFARALRVGWSDCTGNDMQRERQQCPEKPHRFSALEARCDFRSYHWFVRSIQHQCLISEHAAF